jgi:hypothetical protein
MLGTATDRENPNVPGWSTRAGLLHIGVVSESVGHDRADDVDTHAEQLDSKKDGRVEAIHHHRVPRVALVLTQARP